MSYYLISDTHFGHKTPITKGYRPEGFEQLILKNISSLCVELNDKHKMVNFIHLGDVVFGQDSVDYVHYMNEIIHYYNSKIILLKGNHDKKSSQQYLDMGFDWVADEFKMKFGGFNIKFSHRPKKFGNWLNGDVVDNRINIHGHLHTITGENHRASEAIIDSQHKLISMETLQYRPIKLEDVLKSKEFCPKWEGNRFV